MRVRVLGCHGGETPRHRTTCYLIDDRITIDAGAICRSLDLEEQVQIDHMLISHSHMDHVKDLALLADQVIGRRQTPVELHFVVDANAPVVTLRQDGERVAVHVEDTVSDASELVVGHWVDGAYRGTVLLSPTGDATLNVNRRVHEVRVAAQDAAERVGESVIGTPTVQRGETDGPRLARAPARVGDAERPSALQSEGCESTGASPSWAVFAVALLALSRRRRSR